MVTSCIVIVQLFAGPQGKEGCETARAALRELSPEPDRPHLVSVSRVKVELNHPHECVNPIGEHNPHMVNAKALCLAVLVTKRMVRDMVQASVRALLQRGSSELEIQLV